MIPHWYEYDMHDRAWVNSVFIQTVKNSPLQEAEACTLYNSKIKIGIYKVASLFANPLSVPKSFRMLQKTRFWKLWHCLYLLISLLVLSPFMFLSLSPHAFLTLCSRFYEPERSTIEQEQISVLSIYTRLPSILQCHSLFWVFIVFYKDVFSTSFSNCLDLNILDQRFHEMCAVPYSL